MARKRPWGAMNDPRSRVRRLAGRILREELRPAFPDLPPAAARRLLRRAARLQALVEQTMDTIDTDGDPQAAGRLWSLQSAVETQLARLRALAARSPRPTSSAAQSFDELRRALAAEQVEEDEDNA
jgi:hypothetical protein